MLVENKLLALLVFFQKIPNRLIHQYRHWKPGGYFQGIQLPNSFAVDFWLVKVFIALAVNSFFHCLFGLFSEMALSYTNSRNFKNQAPFSGDIRVLDP